MVPVAPSSSAGQAASRGRADAAAVLLERGARVDVLDRERCTPLMVGAMLQVGPPSSPLKPSFLCMCMGEGACSGLMDQVGPCQGARSSQRPAAGVAVHDHLVCAGSSAVCFAGQPHILWRTHLGWHGACYALDNLARMHSHQTTPRWRAKRARGLWQSCCCRRARQAPLQRARTRGRPSVSGPRCHVVPTAPSRSACECLSPMWCTARVGGACGGPAGAQLLHAPRSPTCVRARAQPMAARTAEAREGAGRTSCRLRPSHQGPAPPRTKQCHIAQP